MIWLKKTAIVLLLLVGLPVTVLTTLEILDPDTPSSAKGRLCCRTRHDRITSHSPGRMAHRQFTPPASTKPEAGRSGARANFF